MVAVTPLSAGDLFSCNLFCRVVQLLITSQNLTVMTGDAPHVLLACAVQHCWYGSAARKRPSDQVAIARQAQSQGRQKG